MDLLKNSRWIFLLLQFFLISNHSGGQDTIPQSENEIVLNFDENLDSLLNLYYVQQAISFSEADSMYFFDADSLIPDFPDSVYIERISKLPFVVELSYNRVVKNFIDVYTKKRPDKVSIMLRLSEYYFPRFEDIFDRYGVPEELKYMSVIESALNPRAVSRRGATGLWQFMHYTGKTNGLTINSLVDERKDPIKSTYAAALFLKSLYSIYKDWILVIAAYNCGPGNVNKAIRRSGGKRNYWDIYNYLPRETRGYVPAFIAASYVMNYAKEHKITPANIDFDLHTDSIMITDKLHLRQVSEVLGIPLAQLRDLNPQYIIDIIPADKNHAYSLCIPQVHAMRFLEMEDSVFAFKDSLFFNRENIIVTPTSRSSFHPPVLPSDRYTRLTYEVKSGDNLGFISMWYDVRVSDLRYWNNIRTNTIRSGQKLVIYVPKSKAEKYKDVDFMSFEEKQKGRVNSSTGISSIPVDEYNTKGSDNDEYEYYTVRSGDTLWEIAKRYPGVTDTEIARLNNLKNGDNIQPGQRIRIRRKG